MSPNELLESVKTRFITLMHNEPEKLQNLLIQALRAYQDRAGTVSHFRIEKADGLSIALPEDYLELVAVVDATGDWMYADIINNKIEIENTWGMRWPLTVEYLVQLSALDLDKGTVPPQLVGIIQNYLEALIAIPNTDRVRRASIFSKVDISNLADENTLNQRKTELETEMSSRGAIPRAVTIYSAIGKC
jgi:hypothetical protein